MANGSNSHNTRQRHNDQHPGRRPPGAACTSWIAVHGDEPDLAVGPHHHIGERVEDIFVVQTAAGEALSDTEEIYTLQHTLRQRLDSELGKTIGT